MFGQLLCACGQRDVALSDSSGRHESTALLSVEFSSEYETLKRCEMTEISSLVCLQNKKKSPKPPQTNHYPQFMATANCSDDFFGIQPSIDTGIVDSWRNSFLWRRDKLHHFSFYQKISQKAREPSPWSGQKRASIEPWETTWSRLISCRTSREEKCLRAFDSPLEG